MKKALFLFLLVLFSIAAVGCLPTPTPTATPLPTDTPEPTEPPPPPPTLVPTEVPPPPPPPTVAPVQAVVTTNLNVRALPSTKAGILGKVNKDTTVTLLGRTADDQWFQIAFPEGSDKRGWIAAQFTTLQGNIETVAIVEAPPTPTLTPTKVVTQTVTVQATPAQPSAGKFTILYRSDNNADDDVFMLSEGVTRTTQLTTLTKTDNARLSPDGKTIIFDHVVLEAPFRKTEIFTMNADGSDPHSLSSVENVADYDPAWSPRGTQIVFVRKPRTGLPQIYTFLKDGSGETPRGTIAKTMFKPRWSPDGKFIAYAATRASGGVTPVNRSIYVLNLDDNSESLLTTPDFTTIYDTNQPIWSPDGKLIAFAARNMNEHSNWEAWVMNADGTNPHRVVKAPNPNDGFLPVAWIGARWLLAGWHGNWDVYLSNQDGADLKQLTTDSFNKVPTDMR